MHSRAKGVILKREYDADRISDWLHFVTAKSFILVLAKSSRLGVLIYRLCLFSLVIEGLKFKKT